MREKGSSVWMATRMGVPLALFALCLVGAGVAQTWLKERQRLLLENLQGDMFTAVGRIAGLVSERARDIRSDLLTAAELAANVASAAAPASPNAALMRGHLIALDRSTKHYRRLWYSDRGVAAIEVSGSRAGLPTPTVADSDVAQVASMASAHPGKVATLVPTPANQESAFERLQLFALASAPHPERVVTVLVSMDALFDLLQRRVRLPGGELWLVDAGGHVLVSPDDAKETNDIAKEHRRRILATLASAAHVGNQALGPLPSVWPLGNRGRNSKLLVWQSAQGPTLRWTTGMVAKLSVVDAEVREAAARFVLFGAGLLLLVIAAVSSTAFLYLRQQQLQARVAYRDRLMQVERLSTLGQLAANLAHEIGTPLGVISIRLDALSEKPELAKERRTFQVMKDQIGRISRIMRRMQDAARPHAQTIAIVCLKTVVDRVYDLVEHRLVSKGVSFSSEIGDDVRVRADFDGLHQVMLNLIINASDACSAGDAIRIRAVEDPDADVVRVDIHDTGPGIPSAQRERVFEPFFSTKPADKGSGLGLAIVKDQMMGWDGQVSLSVSTDGTTFTLTWPKPGADVAPAITGGESSLP